MINYNQSLSRGRDARLNKDYGLPGKVRPGETKVHRTWLLSLLFMLMFIGHSALAQVTIQIGSGSGTGSFMPMYSYYGYNYSQQIVTAAEYASGGGGAGAITKIRFYSVSATPTVSTYNDWTIYLGNTAKTAFTSGTDWVPTSAMTQVFSGTVNPVGGGWMEVTLTTPFAYDGASNIVVAVDENAPSYSDFPGSTWANYSSAPSTGIYYYDDVTNPNPANPTIFGNVTGTVAQIQFFGAASSACTGTPAPGNTVASQSAVCSGGTIDFSLQNATAGSGVTYQWQSGPSATGPWTNVDSATSLSYSAPITADIWYQATVTCDGITTISNPVGVTVRPYTECYCIPSTSSGCTDGDVIAQVILNTLNNNSGTGCPSGTLGYSDYTSNPALTTTLQAGAVYNLTVFAGQYSEGYAAWIDYNDDAIFDNTTERVGFSNGQVTGSGQAGVLGSSASFPIVLACNPAVGNHRLRVRAMYATNGIDVTSCGANTYGETEDYLITISEAAACPQPSGLSASNVTSSSADLSWVVGCAETAWEVVVQPEGSGTPTGSGVATTTTSYSVSGLPAGLHEFYVRANCGGDGYSVWTGPFLFSAPLCTTLLTPANGATNVSLAAGYASISWAAATGATSYDVYFGTVSGALTNIGNIVGTAANINNVLYNTTYYWSIAPENTNGTATGCTEFSFTTEMAPADDLCSGATSLDALTSPISSSTMGLADNYSPSCNSTSTGDIGPDKFYSITVGPGYTLQMGLTASGYDSVHAMFYGSCTTQTEIVCTDTEIVQHSWTNNTGSTQTVYWVQDAWFTSAGTFTLAWTLTPPPIDIVSFDPSAVCVSELDNTDVTLTGQYFTGATSVTLNGASHPFTVVDDFTIVVELNASSTAGLFVVTSPISSGTSDTALVINANPVVQPITNGDATLCVDGTVDMDSQSPSGTWSSSDELVATVDGDGVVTGTGGGNAIISYTVTDFGCDTTVTSTVTVIAPIDSTNPTQQTVVVGDDAVFSVVASGGITTYQWMVSTDSGDTFTNLSNDGTYGGVNTDTLTISNTPVEFNNYVYMVVITAVSPCEDFVSEAAILKVGDVGIANPPQDVTLCSPGPGVAQFSVTGSGTIVSYSWEENQGFGFAPIVDGTFGGITYSDSDTNVLTVSGLGLANSGRSYRAIVTGDANSATSGIALLTVNQGVAITGQPAADSVCFSGGSASFTVMTSGANSGYQWQYSTDNSSFGNVVDNTPTGATYSGATSSTLTVNTTSATPAAGTYYYRAIANGISPCGAAISDGAQMTIFTPVITGHPGPASVNSGNTATFTVSTSAPSPSYQWQYSTNGVSAWANVTDATPTGITYTGATSATLNVNVGATAVSSAARYYRAIVTSDMCSVNSNAAQLTVVAYCLPGGNDGASYFDAFSTTGGITNFNNSASGYSAGGYGNFINLSASQMQGASINYNSTIVGGSVGAAIWIDWNQNAIFETTERVANTTSYIFAFSGSFTVPVTALPGNTRMRVVTDYNASNPTNPCASAPGRREFEDYSFTVIPMPQCSGTPVAGTAVSNIQNVCNSGSATLSVSGYTTGVAGITLQWYNSAGAIALATNPTYTTPVLTAPETYYVRVSCSSGGSADSNSVTVGINNPTVDGTTPATRCGAGSVALNATGSAGTVLNWYAAATGGLPLSTGSTFNTPNISTNTTYYVSASIGGSSGNAGTTGNATSTNGTSVGSHGLLFTTSVPNVSINSAMIPFTGTGTITIALRNGSNGSTVSTITTPVVTGNGLVPVSVPLGFNVVNPGNYSLIVTAVSGTVNNLGYKSATYPSTALSGGFSVTAGYWFGVDTFTAMYLFNLNVSNACHSARTAVTATIDTAPALTLSSNSGSYCAGGTTGLVTITQGAADYDNFVWSPSAGVSGDSTNGYTFNPASTTTYTLNTSQNSGSLCQNSVTFTVTVNQYPSTITFSPASPAVCSNGAPVMLTATGGTNAGSLVVGTGTGGNSSTTYPTPYGAYYENAKSQYLIRASELTALGLVAGNTLNSISFNVAALNGSTKHEQYTISIGATAATVLSTWQTGLTQVFGPVEYYPVMGANVHTFNTAFVWNGTANVVVQICHTNDAINGPLDYSNNASVTSSTTSFNSSLSRYVDNAAACPDPLISLTSTSRPNMTFGYSVINAMTWSPVAGLFTDAAGTVPYTGTNVRTVYAKPTDTTTYTAATSSSAGCPVSNEVTVTVSDPTLWYADADGDGYGTNDPEVATIFTCTQPAGYSANNTDCNDAVFAINPGKTEILYNGVDDDCSGTIDDNNQIVTQVITEQCGTTLATLGSSIYAFNINNSTAYRFEVTNTSTGAVQTLVRNLRWFSLTMLPSHEYATTYSIRVEIQRNNVWLGYYGPSCLVSSPAILAPGGDAQVGAAQCGSTLPSLNSIIYTNSINNATGYRFRITNMTDPTAPNQVQTLDRNLRWFNLTMLPTYNYGTTYQIEVSIKTTNGYSGYGSPCLITTPAVPMLNNCDATITSENALIYTQSMHKATAYRFELTHAGTGDVTTIDRPLHWFSFSMFSGYEPGAEYGVRIAVMTTGVYSPYGDACSIFAPGTARFEDVKAELEPQQAFKAIAYPNPYADTFALDVTTSSSSNIQVKVYDMIGKLLEVRDVPVTDMQAQQLGDRYPSGVYNIIVTQDATVKTLRVIKR